MLQITRLVVGRVFPLLTGGRKRAGFEPAKGNPMILQTIALDLSAIFLKGQRDLNSPVPETVVLPLKLCPLLIPGRIELPLIAYQTIVLPLNYGFRHAILSKHPFLYF